MKELLDRETFPLMMTINYLRDSCGCHNICCTSDMQVSPYSFHIDNFVNSSSCCISFWVFRRQKSVLLFAAWMFAHVWFSGCVCGVLELYNKYTKSDGSSPLNMSGELVGTCCRYKCCRQGARKFWMYCSKYCSSSTARKALLKSSNSAPAQVLHGERGHAWESWAVAELAAFVILPVAEKLFLDFFWCQKGASIVPTIKESRQPPGLYQ